MRKFLLKIAIVVLAMVFLSGIALADVIYLKDGTILRGEIVEETIETITIEGDDYWRTIDRNDIKKIVRETKTLPQEKTTVIRQGTNIGIYLLAGIGLFFIILFILAAF